MEVNVQPPQKGSLIQTLRKSDPASLDAALDALDGMSRQSETSDQQTRLFKKSKIATSRNTQCGWQRV